MRKTLFLPFTLIVLFPALLTGGCGTTTSLVSRRALPDRDSPKQRVMVMPAADLTGMPSDELLDTVSAGVTKTLRKTGFFNVYHQNKAEKSASFKPGSPIDPELIREARETGINAIIFETLNPIETNPVKTGIWPFRRKARRFTVSMNVDIVDVNRGTILFSKEVTDNITLSDEETREEKEKSTNVQTERRVLKECLPDIIRKVAMGAIPSLNRQVWTGRIVSAGKGRIIINAGGDSGLRPGIVLEVFGEGESITSLKGQTYQVPGPRVGEIKIVSIKPRRSSAEPLNGTDFKSGQIIRVKE
ncbi:MAG: hypothetical protein JSW35_07395 [Deltaproteobacteria bacterium]|nr:MAG: hypothetical protein JSW35_07395 [Deltaproteobacteria bacterium]